MFHSCTPIILDVIAYAEQVLAHSVCMMMLLWYRLVNLGTNWPYTSLQREYINQFPLALKCWFYVWILWVLIDWTFFLKYQKKWLSSKRTYTLMPFSFFFPFYPHCVSFILPQLNKVSIFFTSSELYHRCHNIWTYCIIFKYIVVYCMEVIIHSVCTDVLEAPGQQGTLEGWQTWQCATFNSPRGWPL